MNDKPRTILYASLAAAAILSFGSMDSVFAEVSDDVMYRALEGKHIWERLEYINGKDNKTIQDEELARDLGEQFREIVAEMNEHGIASPEQWERDPDYWRMKNAPPMDATDSDPVNGSAGQGGSDQAGMAAGRCFCPQEFRFISGFDFTLWGFWPSTAYAHKWEETTIIPYDAMISSVQSRTEHGEITPFVKFGIIKPGSAEIREEYSAENPGGIELGESDPVKHTIIQVIPAHKTRHYAPIANPPIGTDIQVIVDLDRLT